ITIDTAGRVVEFNPAAEHTFGYRKRDVIGRELAELIVPPAQREAHRKGLARYFATGEGELIGRLVEMTAMRSDGTQFPIELELAKVESGRMEFRPESVDLAKLVDGVRDILRGLAASKHLRIDTQVSPEVATAVVDPVRVKQILYNYLSNAIKFTGEGGQIHVRITPEGRDLFRIDVQDTGVGIPAEDLGKLFLEFQQLDASAGKKYQGTGLGLALTKRLAEAHGGRVDVRS